MAVALVVSLLLVAQGIAPGWWLLVNTAVLGGALVFERRGYQPKAPNPGALRPTGERFHDPSSGEIVEVWEDPTTGVREYRPAARR